MKNALRKSLSLSLMVLLGALFTQHASAADTEVRAWGNDVSGELGNGTTSAGATTSPVTVTGLTGVTVTDIAGGFGFTLALVSDGTVRAWGNNGCGQLGDGTTTNRSAPVTVSGLSGVKAIAAGGDFSLAVLNDGTVRAWGCNSLGELGNGTTTNSLSPVTVTGLNSVLAVSAGSFHALALRSNGTVRAWGQNAFGQLGDGTTTDSSSPVAVSGITTATGIAAGNGYSLAVLSDGTVKSWGLNQHGVLGDGTTTNRLTPVAVSGITGAVAVAAGILGGHSLALIKANPLFLTGTVMAWGINDDGELGDGTTTERHTPVAVSGLTGVIGLAAGATHSMALILGGAVQTWGYNAQGELGDGTTTSRSMPVSVTGLSHVIAISAGTAHSLAVVQTNQPPTSKCTDVTVNAGGSCNAFASIDGGSFDPDGDAFSCVQSPLSPYSLGLTSVKLTCTDSKSSSSSCTANVTVQDKTAPAITCPLPTTASAGASCKAPIPNVLGGVAASDNCTAPGLLGKVQSPSAGVQAGLGTTSIGVTVSDGASNTNSCSTSFTVVDTTAPTVVSAVAQPILWSPNHNLVNVGLSATASDNCAASPAVRVIVYSNEGDQPPGDDDASFSPDARDIAPGSLRLRSESSERGSGRVYLIVSQASDGSNTGSSCAVAVVPRDQSDQALSAVNAMAAAAQAYCRSHNGAPPAAYGVVGNGPVVGPKQ